MKKTLLKLKSISPFHYLLSGITIGFLILTATVFKDAFVRIGESFVDLWNSLVYYVDKLFELELGSEVTVNNYSSISWTPVFGLPNTWEAFKLSWSKFWELFFTSENFFGYMDIILLILRVASPVIILIILLILLAYLWFNRYLDTYNNKRNKDSKPLKFCKFVADYTYIPLKRFVRSFFEFLSAHSTYKTLWILIWVFNFNLITICIEFFAYYFYFIESFDVFSIYRQIVKLFCDLSVMINFIPVWLWVLIGLVVFDRIRKKIGFQMLYYHESFNCGFIKERPIVTMICGTMGKKKTTMLTAISLLQNKMFREDALDLMVKNELKFPHFPWCNLEYFLRQAINEHSVYNLATIKDYIKFWRSQFEFALANPKAARKLRKNARKFHKWPFRHNLIFDYDYKRYGLYYDNGLVKEYIWDVISSYAQEYLIYTTDGSYILSNFSVRTDTVCRDVGNLPLYDDDFYHRTSLDVMENSRYAKIINYNALRLGKKTHEDDMLKDSFEFGTIAITEIGKERKNNLQLQELKKKDESANQKNDGFNDWLKMIRHSATVDYVPFVKVISDEQRPESWGADARDLCDVVHIRDSSETKLAMPFFALEELLYSFIFGKFVSLRNRYNHVRADNTVPMWFFRKLTGKINAYYTRIYNQFGFCRLKLEVERGTQDGAVDNKYFYLDNKLVYSDRFSTDCFSDFFETKARNSKFGLSDYPEYETSKASFDELQMQQSYFVDDLVCRKEEFIKTEKTE